MRLKVQKNSYHNAFFALVTFYFFTGTTSVLHLPYLDQEIETLNSKDFDYPDNEKSLDVLWRFPGSIRLEINKFHLNGHGGDFVFISELPPTSDDDYLKELSESENDDYLQQLARLIVTEQGVLLSWKTNKTIEVINPVYGTFVLFHAEPAVPGSTAQFDGFEITVLDYDKIRSTTVESTDDPPVTPRPGQEDQLYLSKFLSCSDPIEFFNNKDQFMKAIAALTTEYCRERNIPCGLALNYTEVHIPGPNAKERAGIHYCDPTWPVYETCVEVTFAIPGRVKGDGTYVLPASQLEEMWRLKKDKLQRDYKYCPYDPPEAVSNLKTVVWISFFLGIILSLTLVLALAWVHNTRALLQHKKSFAEDNQGIKEKIKEVPETDDDEKSPPKHYDVDNPLHKLYPGNVPRSQVRDDLQPKSNYLKEHAENDQGYPFGFRRQTGGTNPAFQEDPSVNVFAYDNRAFVEQEDHSFLDPRTKRKGKKQ